MTVEKVRTGIYNWGFHPALVVLHEEQMKENYEICSIIKTALDEISAGREWYLSSKVEDMQQTYDNILKGCNNPDLIKENMPHYIEEFKKYISNAL